MSEKKKKVPKLRFPGFSGEWEERELRELVKIVGGATPSKENKSYWGGAIVWLSSQEIKSRYVSSGTYTITEKAVRESATKVIPAFTPLIVSRSGILARIFPITLPTVDVAINQDIKALFVNHQLLDNDFFVNQLERKERTILTSIVKTGTTVQSVNMPDFAKLIVSFPSIHEQKKISNVLNDLGNLIDLDRRKLNNAKSLKAGLLQKMFPKEGEDFPEIRFPGFTDSWEKKRLGDLSNTIEYGLNASATSFDGKNKYIRITDIDENSRLFNQDELTSPSLDLSNADRYLVKSGDILFARTGASVGKTYRYQESDEIVYYAGFLVRARIKQDFDVEFVFQNTLTERYENYIKITSQRSGQPGVNAQEYSNFEFMVPELEEQQKIGAFFSQLDALITLHQRKLDNLHQQKKALLQQMFI